MPKIARRGFEAPGLTLLGRAKSQLGQDEVPRLERINAGRHKMLEGPRKPELTEAQKTLAKKRQELARVLEHLQSPGLSTGMARELRKHVAILEREILAIAGQHRNGGG